jgi:AraC-like DNA-binding protein
MEYTEFASDVAVHRTLTTASADENQELMQRFGISQRVRQLGKGSFRSDLAVQITEQAELYSDRFNKACSILLEPPAGSVAILFPTTAGGSFLASGHDVANAGLVILPNGSGADFVIPDLSGSEGIAVPESRFVEMTRVLCPTLHTDWPERMAVIQGDSAQLERLRQAVLDLIVQREDPHPEQVSNLIAETIAWIGRYSERSSPERFRFNGFRRRIAKLAQQYIEDNYRVAVRLEDLCRVSGVGARQLQRIFRGYFGITITEYLKTVRLNAAHRELSVSPPSPGAVTKIALDHGFAHLGRFAMEFRERFGESPKETLASRIGGDWRFESRNH